MLVRKFVLVSNVDEAKLQFSSNQQESSLPTSDLKCTKISVGESGGLYQVATTKGLELGFFKGGHEIFTYVRDERTGFFHVVGASFGS